MTADANSSPKRFWLPVAFVLAIHAALGITAAARLTPTHDEYWHLPVGLLNLKTGRFHFDNLNPPLCRVAAALPLVFTSAQTGPTNADHDAMGWGDVFIAANGSHYGTWFLLGRTMIVLISVLGGLVTAVWARALFGDAAGCLAALFWAFEPNLIAHGSLVTGDMGTAAFFVFTLFAVWKFAQNPGWKTALVFGALLGLAQLAKFTCLLLYPTSALVFVVLILGSRWQSPIERAGERAGERPGDAKRGPTPRFPAAAKLSSASAPRPSTASERAPLGLKSLARMGALWLFALVVSLAVLNAGYLFRGSFTAFKNYDFQSRTLRDAARRFAALGSAPIPLPRDYVAGVDQQRKVMEINHPDFLDGQWSLSGFAHYYLWALFYKVPHPLQLLALAVLLWLVLPGDVPRRIGVQLMLAISVTVMILVADSSQMQLGLRYVLPVFPFLIVFASQAACWLRKAYPLRALVTVLLAAGMLFSVRYHPDHIAYFNELAGGPFGGREHLLDSNLDWGQDLGGLKEYLAAHPGGPIGLAYFGTVPPAALGIAYDIPPGRIPQPGRYAVSVNFIQGRPHWVRTPRNELRPVDIGEFAYFHFFPPIAHIGYSIDVFNITPADVAQWQKAAREGAFGP